jgi:hypothetical protein
MGRWYEHFPKKIDQFRIEDLRKFRINIRNSLCLEGQQGTVFFDLEYLKGHFIYHEIIITCEQL